MSLLLKNISNWNRIHAYRSIFHHISHSLPTFQFVNNTDYSSSGAASSPFSGTTLSWASSSSKSCCHKIHFFKSTVHSKLQNHWQWHANECDFVSMCTYTWTWLCLHISLYAFVCFCTSYACLLLDVSTTSTGTWILRTFWGDSQPEIDTEGEGTARDRNWDRNRDSLTGKHRVKPLMFCILTSDSTDRFNRWNCTLLVSAYSSRHSMSSNLRLPLNTGSERPGQWKGQLMAMSQCKGQLRAMSQCKGQLRAMAQCKG